jgi:Fic family protein
MEEIFRIEKLVETLESLKPLSLTNQSNLEKKLRLEFNYNTNHIEGNTITYSETELLLIFDDVKGNHSLRELEEMKGSDVAFHFIQELAKDNERPLSEQSIKHLNEILLVRPFWKDAITEDGQNTRRLIKVGDYKEHPNSVRLQNGEIFHYADPMETPALMSDLINWFREEESKSQLHPVVLAAMLHYKFVRIHPFDDGNGRISRLLMNYVLFKNNLPPIVIKTENKRNYLSALNKADSGDIESFIKFIAQQLIWSLELSIKAAKGENLDEPGDLDKKIKLLKQKLNSSEEKVQITKSKESLNLILDRNLEPLFLRVSTKLKEFDSLFKSKTEYLSSGNSTFGTTIENCINFLRIQLKSKTFGHITYNYDFKNFRKGPTAYSFSTEFRIEFHDNVYEILSPNGDFNFSKLYHEDLTDKEIDEIVESIGNSIYNQIASVLDI